MRAYVISTGTLFGLLALVHVWRMVEEGPTVSKDPWFILITLAAAGLGVWAWRLIRMTPRA